MIRCETTNAAKDWRCGDNADFNAFTEVRNLFVCDGHLTRAIRDLHAEAAAGGYSTRVTAEPIEDGR